MKDDRNRCRSHICLQRSSTPCTILLKKSAYHLYGNFGENCPTNSSRILFATKTGMGFSCTIYKIPVNPLSRKEAWHWQSTKMVQKVSVISVTRGKGNISEDITSFPKNFHQDEPFHLNSHRNCRVFDTNGKRSKSHWRPICKLTTAQARVLVIKWKKKLTSFIIRMVTRNHWWHWSVFVFVLLILLFSWKRLYRCRTFFFLSLLREFPPMDTKRQFSPKKDEAP